MPYELALGPIQHVAEVLERELLRLFDEEVDEDEGDEGEAREQTQRAGRMEVVVDAGSR